MSRAEQVTKVSGTVETTDGVTTEFVVYDNGEWQQWGGTTEDLGAVIDVVEKIAEGIVEHQMEAQG